MNISNSVNGILCSYFSGSNFHHWVKFALVFAMNSLKYCLEVFFAVCCTHLMLFNAKCKIVDCLME